MKTKKFGQLCAGVCFVIFLTLLDQASKLLAVRHLKDAPSIPILSGVFELSYLENHGAAFGILQGQKAFLILITAASFCLLLYLYIRIPQDAYYFYMRLVLVLLLSGAVGNFIDRCLHDYVIDFFYFSLIDFPVFNVADIYVTTAAVLLIFLFFFYYKEEDLDMLYKQLAFWKKKEID